MMILLLRYTFVGCFACSCLFSKADSVDAQAFGGQATTSDALTTTVEMVVGGLMPEEGGEWDPAKSPLLRPFGVDFDGQGTMFVVELEGGRVFSMEAGGALKQISGDGSSGYRGDGGPAAKAVFNGMHNCAVLPGGDVFISDSWNHCIRRIDAQTGVISTIAGTGERGFRGDGGAAKDALFDYVMCITLTANNDKLLVADLNNRRIRSVDLQTGVVETLAGNGEKGIPADGSRAIDSPLVDPRAVASDSKGNVYILERSGHAVRLVRPDGTIHTVVGNGQKGFLDGPAPQARLNSPKHLCVDADDNLYIADDENAAIRFFDVRSGTVSTVLGRGQGDARIRLSHPHGVCWQDGLLYVTDTSHNRILRLAAPAGSRPK